MKQIKFSHQYNKMPKKIKEYLTDPQSYYSAPENYFPPETKLLEVVTADSRDFSEHFLGYDTTFLKETIEESYGTRYIYEKYPLPKGPVLILILQTKGSINQGPELWTTIRRYTKEKHEYYKQLRGQKIEIMLIGEK